MPGRSSPTCSRPGRSGERSGTGRQFLFRLGQLCEERLSSPDRAAEAYEAAVATDPRHLPSLRALEAHYEGAGRARSCTGTSRRSEPHRRPGGSRAGARQMGAPAATLSRLDESVVLFKELWRSGPVTRGRWRRSRASTSGWSAGRTWRSICGSHLPHRGSPGDRPAQRQAGAGAGHAAGRPDPGGPSYKAVLDSDPRNRRALEALRDIYAMQGDPGRPDRRHRRLVPLQEDATGVKQVRLELAEALLRGRAEARGGRAGQAGLRHRAARRAEELARVEDHLRQAGAAARGREGGRGPGDALGRAGRAGRGRPGLARGGRAVAGPQAARRGGRGAREGARARAGKPRGLPAAAGPSTPSRGTGAPIAAPATSSSPSSTTPPRSWPS